MAHVIGDDCISCGLRSRMSSKRYFWKEMANTRSTLMLVSTVVHVQHSAQ